METGRTPQEISRLQESEERWRAVFENSAIGIALTDLNGRFLATNSAYQRMVGYSPDEFQSLGFIDITHEDDRDRNRILITELLEGMRDQFQIEKRYWRKDGALIWVRNSVSLVPGSERMPVSIMAIVEDITEHKRGEEALHAMQMEFVHLTRVAITGEIAASIAHEISQPLTAVITNANASLRWLSRDRRNLVKSQEALTRILRDANRASDVIGRIRALLKKTPPQMRPLDVNELIQDVLVLTRNELVRNRISLRTELKDDLPVLRGDRVQLQQVILNLIVNSVEAMREVPNETRNLLVVSRRHDSEEVLVSVRDSGVGIAPDMLEKIFTPFFTTKTQGLGMGLSISRSIIEAHAGRLWATGHEGRGTTFQFSLPVGPTRIS